MEIRILAEKKLISRKDVHTRYESKGAVIFYEPDKENDKFVHIIAEADYIQDGNDSYFRMLTGEYECLNGLKRKAIKPRKVSNVSMDNLYIMESDYIYEMEMKEKIYEAFHRYRTMRKNLSKNDMNIYYYEDRTRNATAFFGTSIDPDFDVEELRKESHMPVTSISYKDYLWGLNLYNKTKNEAASEEEPEDEEKPQGIMGEIKAWVKSTSYEEFEQAICERIIGQPELSKVLASVYSYLSAKADGEKTKFDVLLAAPSGCGKTETFRALRDYFKDRIPNLPLFQTDMTQITEEGFTGKNTNAIISALLNKEETKGVGIIWLDEFDKKLMPRYSSKGDNVNESVQAQILTLIEGRIAEEGKKSVDTGNTLFIACGSFDECRKKKGKVIKHVGFGSENEGGVEHYTPITKQDMIELGASYELIGRFPLLVNFQKLSEQAIFQIIDKTIWELREKFHIFIQVDLEFREKIFEQANSEYGCRQITSMLTEAVMPAFVEALKIGHPERHEIWVDKNGNARLVANKFMFSNKSAGLEEKTMPAKEIELPPCG